MTEKWVNTNAKDVVTISPIWSDDTRVVANAVNYNAQILKDALNRIAELEKTIKHKAETVEAIPKDQYETRLKADMVAMLEEIESMFWELTKNKYDMQILYEKADNFEADFNSFIQQKINSLKEAKYGKDK